MKLRFFDYIALSIAVLVIAGFSVHAYAGRTSRGEVVIEASGVQWIYPLNVDCREAVPGPLGDTIVVIRDGKASVEDSPCRDKLCVRMPSIDRPGQWIACLPNRVFIRVHGSSGEKIDDLSW